MFELSKKFPSEEIYSLTDQVRRAARSIGAQISEAWAKRDYEKHFVSKLSDALGECNETQHWTISAMDDGYLSREEAMSFGSSASKSGEFFPPCPSVPTNSARTLPIRESAKLPRISSAQPPPRVRTDR